MQVQQHITGQLNYRYYSGIDEIIINKWIDKPYIRTDGIIELASQMILFHSAAVASIFPNCKHYFLEFVILKLR